MGCDKCKFYEPKDKYTYDCKFMRSGKTSFQSDSTDTAECCKYYKEV